MSITVNRPLIDRNAEAHECFQRPMLSFEPYPWSSSCLKGARGICSERVDGARVTSKMEGRGETDARDESWRADRSGERYETAVLLLWRQVLVYRPIRAHRVIPCRSYAPFVSRGAHPVYTPNQLSPLLSRHIISIDDAWRTPHNCGDFMEYDAVYGTRGNMYRD